ncbi:MAG TPA: TIGR00266 family protein [Polyangiaceae bacterium]|nr:TIGR00266 family protein [Polyangiaceae bacterium]HMR78630.1 TIGR00266 family protein [Polyangiaceae bacterium]
MQIEVKYRPAHSLATVQLAPGEGVIAESGAMVGMSPSVQMQTQSGGLMSGLKRMFGGESFFRNTFTAGAEGGEVLLAHALCGDMAVLDMAPGGYFVQSSSFIASTPNVQIETKVGGFRSFFAGEGVFVLQASCQGPGQLLVGAFGGIQELTCDGNMVIDTGHLVAWDTSLTYNVTKSGSGWVASFLSGEGLVCHFSGQGRIWIQTRNPAEYGHSVGKLLPPREG